MSFCNDYKRAETEHATHGKIHFVGTTVVLHAGHLTAKVRKCRRCSAVLVRVVELAVSISAERRCQSELQPCHSLFDQAPVRNELLKHLKRIICLSCRHRFHSRNTGRSSVHAGAWIPSAMVPPFQTRYRSHSWGIITLSRGVGHTRVWRGPVAGPVGHCSRAWLESLAQL